MPSSPFKLQICHMKSADRKPKLRTKSMKAARANSKCGKKGKTMRCSSKHKGMAYCVKKPSKKK